MKPLVLVHGFMGGSDQWADQIEAFGGSSRLVSVDLPGFGKNSAAEPCGGIGAYADWVIEYLRSQNVNQYHLLGHSMGGMIAQDIAHKEQDRVDRLVLYSTGALGNLPGRFEPIETSKQRAQSDGAQATARRIARSWFLEGDKAERYAVCAAIAEQASLPAILAGLDAMQDWSGEAALETLGAETLVLWGDKDRTYKWPQIQVLWSQLPRSHLAVVPGCAHAVHLEKPRFFNELVGDFLC